MEQHSEENLRWKAFEAALKKPLPEDAVNYKRVEQRLFQRISKSSKLGALSQLQVDEVNNPIDWEGFENNLFHRIAEHEEYDETVDDYIREEESLPQSQWDRLEAKVDSGMRKADSLPEFERLVKAEGFLLFGQWEQVEKKLFQRINAFSLPEGGWENALQEDKAVEFTSESREERKLEAMMDHVDNMAVWERWLSQEQYLDGEKWETIEKGLFDKIERHKKFHLISKPAFWLSFDWFFRTHAQARVSLFLIVFLGITLFGWRQYSNHHDIPTLVYRAQGGAVEKFKRAYFTGGKVVSSEGSALTLVNQRGFFEIQNGPGIEILKASKSNVHYKLQNGSKKDEETALQGSATFYVSRSQSSRKFRVSTPDYDIKVTGTYFKVQPDLEGRYTTQVLEGNLKIVKDTSEIKLSAGQMYSYNYKKQAFSVEDGGSVLYRKEIKHTPQVEELENYPSLKISTNEINAEIRLNGIHMGQSPLAILHPPGRYSLQVTLRDFQTVDTVVTLEAGMRYVVNLKMQVVTPPPPEEEPVRTVKPKHPGKVVKPVAVEPQKIKEKLAYAESLEKSDWHKAIEIYQEILSGEASRLEKENALFSAARLKAINYRNKDRAAKDFLQYLALYPEGAFAGESWLRLAEIEIKNHPEKAIGYYQRFFKKYPYHHRVSELQHRVGLIYLQMKKYDSAIRMFEESLTNLLSSQKELRHNIYASYHSALVASGETQKAQQIEKLLK